MRIDPLTVRHCEKLWPLVGPMLNEVAEIFPDDWPMKEIARGIRARELLVWLISDPGRNDLVLGAVITRVDIKPSGRKVLEIVEVAGSKIEEWVPLISVLEDYGCRMGCVKSQFMGRAGWERLLPDYTSRRMVVCEKELTPDGRPLRQQDRANGADTALRPRRARSAEDRRPGAGEL